MANSRDFTGKNRKFTGTKGVTVPKGTTGQRVGSESGELRFNTTTELMEYYDGNAWKPIDAPPTITSISTSDAQGTNNILNADGSTLHTITITGGNFGVGLNVKFIGNTGTEYTAGNINRVSISSITCKTTASMGTSDDPYDVQVINTSGLSATLEDAFSFNAAPVFVNASGQLGTVYNGQVITGTTLNAGATDAEANTITFSIISGALPGTGLTLSSSTGAITGTLASTPSLGNYPFVVRAATTEGTVERQFSIQVIALPTYTVEYLVVAGGGGGGGNGGGGGGAGGVLDSSQSVTATTEYTVTIGGGGAGSPSGGGGSSTLAKGINGANSVFASNTATGGGGGGVGHNVVGNDAGLSGGSGGGGGSLQPANTGPGGTATAGQGNAGGTGVHVSGITVTGGGGGGKNQAGQPSGNNFNGNGGNGINWNSLGTSYAGGGAGGGLGSGGTAGTGGGGATQGGNSPVNTGGGGGGGVYTTGGGGSGGSGIVIIRYQSATQKGSGGTVTTAGGYYYHTFTSSGTYTG